MSARLVLRWATMSRFSSRCRTFILLCNQPATQGQLSLPSLLVGKWGPASAGKAKRGMVHSISRWTPDVQVKLWDPLRTCAIPERLRGMFTTFGAARIDVIKVSFWIFKPLWETFEKWTLLTFRVPLVTCKWNEKILQMFECLKDMWRLAESPNLQRFERSCFTFIPIVWCGC